MVALTTPKFAQPQSFTPAGNKHSDLADQIDSRTFRQVRNLHVTYDADKVVVHGCSESYYVKQLATHAVLDLLPGVSLDNRINVNRC